MKHTKGFTIMEVLLYSLISAVFIAALLQASLLVLNTQSKSTTEQEVSSEARQISQRIKFEIRNATDLDAANSTFNNTNGVLSLCTSSGCATKNIIRKDGDKITIQIGSAGAPQVALNSRTTRATGLTFRNHTGSGAKNIGFTLNLSFANSINRQEFQGTISIQSSAELRSF